MGGCLYGAPGEIRTPDPLVRSQVLYPTELRALNSAIIRYPAIMSSLLLFYSVFLFCCVSLMGDIALYNYLYNF